MNMGQDRQIQNVEGNGRNQFGQYDGQVAQNQQRFNAWQNGGIQGAQNAGGQSGGNQNGLVVIPGIANQSGTGNRAEGTGIGNQARCYNYRGLGHIARNCTARPRRRDAAYLQTQLLIAQKEEAGIQLKVEEFDFMAAAGDLDEIEEVNANCILMANLQHVSTSSTQHDMAPVYDTDGSAEETVYRNLVDQVAQVNRVNSNMRATIAELKSELARYKIQEQRVEIRTSVTPHVDKPKLSAVPLLSKKLHASMPNVIAHGMFKINPSQVPRVDLVPNKQSSESIRKNPITNSQRHVTVKENVSSNTVTASSTGLVHTARTRRPQPKGNTRNARVPSASKSSKVKKSVTIKDHRRTLLLSKNRKTMSSECNNIKLAIWNDKSKIVCDTCKQCLVTANHDACLTPSVNVLNSRANKLCANVPLSANQNRHRTQV
nr:hypothetical protein [Tanacetum cinerariifolium]